MSYTGHQATTGMVSGTTLFTAAYDANGNITHKRRYDRGDGVSYYHHRLYNTENKMVQVLTINGSTVTRQSDQFYHLDGSRLWEGIMDHRLTVIGHPDLVLVYLPSKFSFIFMPLVSFGQAYPCIPFS